MKNPTSGDFAVMLNSVYAAQHPHHFTFAGYEVKTTGNPLAHTILRGAVSKHGNTTQNYHYEDMMRLYEMYQEMDLVNPATIIDFSGKRLVTDTLMVVGGKFYTAEAWRQRSTESALDIPITEALDTDSTTADSAKVVPEKPKPKVKPEAPKTPAVHVVRQGDTLYGIARRYHTTVAKICKLNGIDEDAILSLGQKINIPK